MGRTLTAPAKGPRVEDVKGGHRIALGAGQDATAVAISLIFPRALLRWVFSTPGGFLQLGSTSVRFGHFLLRVSETLFPFPLMPYRRGFAA